MVVKLACDHLLCNVFPGYIITHSKTQIDIQCYSFQCGLVLELGGGVGEGWIGDGDWGMEGLGISIIFKLQVYVMFREFRRNMNQTLLIYVILVKFMVRAYKFSTCVAFVPEFLTTHTVLRKCSIIVL